MGNTALMIIDAQLVMFDYHPPVFEGITVLQRLKQLAANARAASVPVIFIQHSGRAQGPTGYGKKSWGIHPELGPEKTDIIVHKRFPDAFQDTELREILNSLKVSHLVMAGFTTEMCLDTTCRRAFSLGYQVTLIEDGHSTIDNPVLAAPLIIEHHNYILGGFTRLQKAADVRFLD